MRPDVVTFWHGPLDALRLTCLRSQVAAGHKVTVYSFDPLAGLPDGVGNAEAEAILPHSFSERLRPPNPDGSWRDWTILAVQRFLPHAADGGTAPGCGSTPTSVAAAGRARSGKTLFRLGDGRRQLGNSVLYLPPDDPNRARVRKSDGAGGVDAGLAGAAPSPDLCMLRQLRGRSNRLSDIRVAIYGPAALTALARRTGELQHALPKQSFYAVHAEPKPFFEPADFSGLLADPDVIGLHISPKGRGSQPPVPGSLYAWAAEKFGSR